VPRSDCWKKIDMNDENRLPEHAYKYFWDIDPAELDVSQHPRYVIERLLEYGDFPELRWLFGQFSHLEIVETLQNSRKLSLRSASFWAQILNVPRRQVRCLSKRFQQTHNQIWQR
jgi:hypothetical protein